MQHIKTVIIDILALDADHHHLTDFFRWCHAGHDLVHLLIQRKLSRLGYVLAGFRGLLGISLGMHPGDICTSTHQCQQNQQNAHQPPAASLFTILTASF